MDRYHFHSHSELETPPQHMEAILPCKRDFTNGTLDAKGPRHSSSKLRWLTWTPLLAKGGAYTRGKMHVRK